MTKDIQQQIQAEDLRTRYFIAYRCYYDTDFPPLPDAPVVPWPPVPVWPAIGLEAAPDGTDQTATNPVASPENGGFACCTNKCLAQFLWPALIFVLCLVYFILLNYFTKWLSMFSAKSWTLKRIIKKHYKIRICFAIFLWLFISKVMTSFKCTFIRFCLLSGLKTIILL